MSTNIVSCFGVVSTFGEPFPDGGAVCRSVVLYTTAEAKMQIISDLLECGFTVKMWIYHSVNFINSLHDLRTHWSKAALYQKSPAFQYAEMSDWSYRHILYDFNHHIKYNSVKQQ